MDCRFSYSDSLCAHKDVSGHDCDGHDECDHFAVPYFSEGPMNIQQTPVRSDMGEGCPDRRFAVYCARVKKFICKGPKDCDFQ